jgi:hypothetical protein
MVDNITTYKNMIHSSVQHEALQHNIYDINLDDIGSIVIPENSPWLNPKTHL